MNNLNNEKFIHNQHKNKLDDITSKLDNKRTEEESKIMTLESIYREILKERDLKIENLTFHSENCVNELLRFDRVIDSLHKKLQEKDKEIKNSKETNADLNKEIINLLDNKQKI